MGIPFIFYSFLLNIYKQERRVQRFPLAPLQTDNLVSHSASSRTSVCALASPQPERGESMGRCFTLWLLWSGSTLSRGKEKLLGAPLLCRPSHIKGENQWVDVSHIVARERVDTFPQKGRIVRGGVFQVAHFISNNSWRLNFLGICCPFFLLILGRFEYSLYRYDVINVHVVPVNSRPLCAVRGEHSRCFCFFGQCFRLTGISGITFCTTFKAVPESSALVPNSRAAYAWN
jgi:hypothetical protein